MCHAIVALGQDLKDMPVGLPHDSGDLQNVAIGNGLVEEIAHRIDEDLSGAFPAKGLRKFLRNQPNVESLFEGMSRNTSKTLCKSLRIAVLTSGADLRAASDRIPRRIRPFDLGMFAHDYAPHPHGEYTADSPYILPQTGHV